MSTSPLSVDVYVSPLRPYNSPDQLGAGEVATWPPSSSTLISGPAEGILIDALLTVRNADEIAAWAKGFGKTITGIYRADAGSIHFQGNDILQLDPGQRRRLGIEMIYQDLSLAKQQDVTPHGFMLEAIREKVEAEEARLAFHAEAEHRLARMKKTGVGIPAQEVFEYLQRRAGGRKATRPKPRKLR